MVHVSLAVAEKLSREGISLEVVDLRTISPLDKRSVIDSVKKTGRAVIVHEENKTAGVGAEVSAVLSEEVFSSLKAPIRRVATPDVTIPYSPAFEAAIFPNEAKVEAAVRETLAWGK